MILLHCLDTHYRLLSRIRQYEVLTLARHSCSCITHHVGQAHQRRHAARVNNGVCRIARSPRRIGRLEAVATNPDGFLFLGQSDNTIDCVIAALSEPQVANKLT